MRYLLTVLLLSVLISCKKSEEPFQSYLHMTLDGVKMECERISASKPAPSSTELLRIVGYLGEASNIEIELYDFNNTTGEKTFTPPSRVTLMVNDTYVAQGEDVKIIITEVSERYIKGTFNFIVKMSTGPNTFLSKTITDGEFHIKR